MEKVTQSKNTAQSQSSGGTSNLMNFIIIVSCLVVGFVIWKFIMGADGNFKNPAAAHLTPKDGSILGAMYLGGPIVALLVGTFLILVVFIVERLIGIKKISGNGDLAVFVRKIQNMVANGQIDAAISECDKQQGSLANVVKAGLRKYNFYLNEEGMDKEQKIGAMKKELEEATSLELPMMSKNMTIVSTIVTAGTLIGLIGTVSGMIKAFSAMGAGAPDPAMLSIGISEALYNTALGISTSLLAILAYNYLSSVVDDLTYKIDEAGFSVVETFASKVK